MRRLFDEDMLRPLRLMSQATQDVLTPDRRIVEAWAVLLREELGRSRSDLGQAGSAHLKHRRSRPRSIMRDAETLAQLHVLNGGARGGARPVGTSWSRPTA